MFAQIKDIKRYVRKVTPEGHLPYLVDDVRKGVLDALDVNYVDIHELDLEGNPIKGMYLRYEFTPKQYAEQETKITVVVDCSENYCWQRFIACKELCQALFDEDQFKISSWDELNTLVVDLLLSDEAQKLAVTQNPKLVSEIAAERCALEILCPLEDRKELLPKFQIGDLTAMEIASEYRIPVDYIEGLFDRKTMVWAEKIFGI